MVQGHSYHFALVSDRLSQSLWATGKKRIADAATANAVIKLQFIHLNI